MRYYAFLILMLFPAGNSFSQDEDYKMIFGKDWDKAETFVLENELWMKQMSTKYHISYPVSVAIVFPELVRYSALRDKIEITLLKALYINLGDEYSDFSIGPFQMKPSFAEFVRSKAVFLKNKTGSQFRKKARTDSDREIRKQIVNDLEEAGSQFIYLIAFIRICERSLGLEKSDELEKVRILSAAYNCGPDKAPEKIKEMAGKKFFNTKLFKTKNYSYSDVSLYWYKAYAEESRHLH